MRSTILRLLLTVALPCVVLGAVLYEGLALGFSLLNYPNDGSAVLGVAVIVTAIALVLLGATFVFSNLIRSLDPPNRKDKP